MQLHICPISFGVCSVGVRPYHRSGFLGYSTCVWIIMPGNLVCRVNFKLPFGQIWPLVRFAHRQSRQAPDLGCRQQIIYQEDVTAKGTYQHAIKAAQGGTCSPQALLHTVHMQPSSTVS